MTNNGTLNYNLTSEKPAYMLSKENYTKYINERNKFDPTYPDPNDIRFDAPQYSYSVEETSLYRESSSGEQTLVGSVYYPKTGNLVKFENNQAIELDEPVTGNKVPLNSVKKLIPGIEYEFVPITPDYSNEYLTFVALEDGTFTLSTNAVNYSTDNGKTWTELAANTASPTVTSGSKIMWKGTLTPASSVGIGTFSATGNFNVQGNAMSLLFGDNFKGQTDLTGKNYAFYRLFRNNTKVVNANNLSLPATILANYCYAGMFDGCTSLTTAPELPATTLANNCYDSMFYGCTSLTTAPELPATILANYCYTSMFNGCTSLTTAPELPATTLTSYCYWSMFYGCTSLTTAPELPATTLASGCYKFMFRGCTSLNYIKAMFTTTPGTNYTSEWVFGVSSTGTFVKNSAAQWNVTGVNGVPSGWTVETAQ